MSRVKHLLRGWVPPLVLEQWRRRTRWQWFEGDFGGWADAIRASDGYDSSAVSEKVLASARLVRDGQAAFERDGVAFAVPEYNWPVLSALLLSAARLHGRLQVVDFGGALGSLYWQHRDWFKEIEVDWRVVEQPMFVRHGRAEFTTGGLTFWDRLPEASAGATGGVLLLAGVLPYLENPRALLEQALGLGFHTVIFERTALIDGLRDKLVVQRVPPEIYAARYPCWWLSREWFVGRVAREYGLVAELPEWGPLDPRVRFSGSIHERRAP